MHMCMHTTMYVCLHKHIHTYTYIQTYIHKVMHVCLHRSISTFIQYTCMSEFIHICMHTYIHTNRLMDMCAYTYTCMDTYIENIHRRNYHDLLDSFDLKQIVEVVTHEDGHTLDHIVIPTVSNVQFTEIEQSHKISYHYFIHANISFSKPAVKRDIVNYRCFKMSKWGAMEFRL